MNRQEGFYCPHCNTSVTSQDKKAVNLNAKLESEFFSVEFPISLPARLGTYGAEYPSYIELKKGAKVSFYCPHCNTSITLPEKETHAYLKMTDSQQREKVIIFNQIFGEHDTFVFDLDTHKIVAAYGDDQNRYIMEFNNNINFFGV